MTQSDWDSLCVDEHGQPTNGISAKSPAGVIVEACFDFLNVYDRQSHRFETVSPAPIVMTLRDGELCYQDIYLVTQRGPQAGIYYATWFSLGDRVHASLGLACNGYLSFSDLRSEVFHGVLPASVAFLKATLQGWKKDLRIPMEIASVSLDGAQRFNQGDAVIGRKVGFVPESTSPGSAAEPLAYQYARVAKDVQEGIQRNPTLVAKSEASAAFAKAFPIAGLFQSENE